MPYIVTDANVIQFHNANDKLKVSNQLSGEDEKCGGKGKGMGGLEKDMNKETLHQSNAT